MYVIDIFDYFSILVVLCTMFLQRKSSFIVLLFHIRIGNLPGLTQNFLIGLFSLGTDVYFFQGCRGLSKLGRDKSMLCQGLSQWVVRGGGGGGGGGWTPSPYFEEIETKTGSKMDKYLGGDHCPSLQTSAVAPIFNCVFLFLRTFLTSD